MSGITDVHTFNLLLAFQTKQTCKNIDLFKFAKSKGKIEIIKPLMQFLLSMWHGVT